jgi:hypothetical protein
LNAGGIASATARPAREHHRERFLRRASTDGTTPELEDHDQRQLFAGVERGAACHRLVNMFIGGFQVGGNTNEAYA